MKHYKPSEYRWWNKPLVLHEGRHLPAELVVLSDVLEKDEAGAWLNSRGTKTGVCDLKQVSPAEFQSVRSELPGFVESCLVSIYKHPEIRRGVYDLVIWREFDERIRFVEVKCPHWDRPTPEQRNFAALAADRGIRTQVIEWEFL